MPVKIFNLRNVPDDELNEIRAILSENRISFYETPPGNWGISSPAIWLKNNDDVDKAKEILNGYHKQRQTRIRQEFVLKKKLGEGRTIVDVFRENPLRFVFYLLVVAGLLYISIKPFIAFL